MDAQVAQPFTNIMIGTHADSLVAGAINKHFKEQLQPRLGRGLQRRNDTA